MKNPVKNIHWNPLKKPIFNFLNDKGGKVWNKIHYTNQAYLNFSPLFIY